MHLTGIAEHVWTLWAWETVFCTVNGNQILPLNSEGKGEIKICLFIKYLFIINFVMHMCLCTHECSTLGGQ